MARRTDLARLLRLDPVLAPRVVEVAGWQDRGSATFDPRGFVWHHTAGPRAGNSPSLSICIFGRTGLPGPLCNVFLGRDGTVYVVAAGRANHAGTGGWRGLSGNSSVWGLEVENIGTPGEPWTELLLDLSARIAAALEVPGDSCCHHKEWTSRKVDMHTVTGDAMRDRVRLLNITPSPAPAPPVDPLESPMYFLVADGVGLFVVADGVPIGFPNVATYAQARDESEGAPVLWLAKNEGTALLGYLRAKLAASVA